MITITTYHIKPFLSAAETKELMGVFAEVGAAPGTLAHYVFADGGGGVTITDSDDPVEGYKAILPYRDWIEFDAKVVLPVEDAVPHILESLH